MRLSFVLRQYCACALLGVGAVSAAQAQQPPPDNANLPQTVTWLRSTIAQSGGFSYKKTTTAGPKVEGPVQERLAYTILEVEPCHLGWNEVASGDEEIKMLHPEKGPDQDFGVVEPRSATVLPVDLATEEGAGPSEDGSMKIAIQPGAAKYWKVTARWAFVHNDGVDEPFGFVFSDQLLAEHVAMVLDHAIDLCSGPRNLVGDGCTTYTEKIEKHTGALGGTVTYTNQGSLPITCVERMWIAPRVNDPFNLQYFNSHAIEIGIPMRFTLKPGESFAPGVDGPNAPDVRYSEAWDSRRIRACFREHSVDNVGNQCTDLHLKSDIP